MTDSERLAALVSAIHSEYLEMEQHIALAISQSDREYAAGADWCMSLCRRVLHEIDRESVLPDIDP